MFNAELEKFRLHNLWRVSKDEDGSMDPWGLQAVHASISKALFGVHYISTEMITLSLELASFVFLVLSLAMEDRTLQGNERLTLAGELKAMEEKIVGWEPSMKRLSIKFEEGMPGGEEWRPDYEP
jgi:hypothetical protein